MRLAVAQGVRHFEIRGVNGHRCPDAPAGTMEELKALREEFGISYSALSPGIFKLTLDDPQREEQEMALMQRSIAFARELGIRHIVVFGLVRATPEDDRYAEAAACIRHLAEQAADADMDVWVENEPNFFPDTAANIQRLLEAVGHNRAGLNWDAGNMFRTTDRDFREGLLSLMPWVRNVHMKDAYDIGDGRWSYAPLGEGSIDFSEQLRLLKTAGYQGHVTVETHCGPLPEAFLRSCAWLRGALEREGVPSSGSSHV